MGSCNWGQYTTFETGMPSQVSLPFLGLQPTSRLSVASANSLQMHHTQKWVAAQQNLRRKQAYTIAVIYHIFHAACTWKEDSTVRKDGAPWNVFRENVTE